MNSKLDIVIGALTASLIPTIASLLALFQENPELTFQTMKQSTAMVVILGGVGAFIKDFQALWFRRMSNKITGKMKPPGSAGMMVILCAMSLPFLSGCSFLQENESGARIAASYATIQAIDGDSEKAERVFEIASEVDKVVGDNTATTVDYLIQLIRDEIRWEKLDPAETSLVELLLLELRTRLIEELGDGYLPEDARLTVQMVAGWVMNTASLYLDE